MKSFAGFNLAKLLKNNLVRLLLLVVLSYIGYTYFVKAREGVENHDNNEEEEEEKEVSESQVVENPEDSDVVEPFTCGCNSSLF